MNITKKEADKLVVTCAGVGGKIRSGAGGGKTIEYKIGYENILCNMGNRANILLTKCNLSKLYKKNKT